MTTFPHDKVCFPLTLTLSLGEREQQAARFSFSNARLANPVAGFRVRRDTILPLPKGEGRGEGKENGGSLIVSNSKN
jgi:hypothetical protein